MTLLYEVTTWPCGLYHIFTSFICRSRASSRVDSEINCPTGLLLDVDSFPSFENLSGTDGNSDAVGDVSPALSLTELTLQPFTIGSVDDEPAILHSAGRDIGQSSTPVKVPEEWRNSGSNTNSGSFQSFTIGR